MKPVVKYERIVLPVSEIKFDEKNPNCMTKRQTEALNNSIKKFGYVQEVIIDKETKFIADGEHRLKELIKQGVKEIEVIAYPFENETERRIFRQMANKLKGTHDSVLDDSEYKFIFKENQMDELQKLLGESDKKLVQFMASIEKEGLGEDIVPDVEKPKYDVKLGDVWELGDHRLVCGDSTDKQQVTLLMQGKQADMVFTDPPYGINIVNSGNVGISANTGFVRTTGLVKAKKYSVIEGDDKPFDPSFMLDLAPKIFIFGANNFASKLPDNSHWLVWDKKAEKGADHNNFSDVELIWTNIDRKSCVIYRYLWSGLLREGSRDIELKERVHPTQKPVGLLIDILNDYSESEDIVLDLFGGSGSTLIACEKLNRKCRMMELDTKYCSVIIERWENLTGKKANKVS